MNDSDCSVSDKMERDIFCYLDYSRKKSGDEDKKKERKSMFPGSYDIEYALRVHTEMETQVRLLVV